MGEDAEVSQRTEQTVGDHKEKGAGKEEKSEPTLRGTPWVKRHPEALERLR
jgi:hypothetical protein